MDKQTFIDDLTKRGYELRFIRNGNITATNGGYGSCRSPTTSCTSTR